MLARDIMTPDVVVVPPEMPVEEVGALLVDNRIHGAPVVDEVGRLVGMVSLVDLVGRTGETAQDVMTPDPVCAGEETPVEEIAGMMLEQAIRRVPIVRDGRVVGIISASDIIGLFLNLHERELASRPSARKNPGRGSQTRGARPGAPDPREAPLAAGREHIAGRPYRLLRQPTQPVCRIIGWGRFTRTGAMRYARTTMVLLGAALGLTLVAFALYVGYVTRLWYEASGNW